MLNVMNYLNKKMYLLYYIRDVFLYYFNDFRNDNLSIHGLAVLRLYYNNNIVIVGLFFQYSNCDEDRWR